MLRRFLFVIFLGFLAACQQTPEQKATAARNMQAMSDSAVDMLSAPATACAQYFSTGTLPKADLIAAGFGENNNGLMRQVTPSSFSVPGGTRVTVATTRRNGCNMIVSNAPFRLNFARNAVIRGLINDGWSHQGDLVYTKGDRTLRMSGGESYGLVSIQLLPA